MYYKLVIADDENIILGSANVNDRSMTGIKDSEIGLLLRQNGSENENNTRKSYGFRMHIWSGYLGAHKKHPNRVYEYNASILQNPESPECIQYIQSNCCRLKLEIILYQLK